MAFMQLGGAEGRPTFFEVYAADKLVPTLKAAVIYSLSVLGQSRGWVLRLLNYEDEVFAAVALLLERHSLSNFHATFAESLYGLKRQPAPLAQTAALSASAQGSSRLAATDSSGRASQQGSLLTTRHQHQALLCQVLLPYLKAKLDGWYSRHATRGVLGLALTTAQQRQQQQQAALEQHGSRALLLLYPYIRALMEAIKFCYQLNYLLDVFDCHSPVLHLLGQRLVRLSAPERLRRWWLAGSSLATDHLRTVIILSVFGFKILEWWYTSGEDQLSSGAAVPHPPPPAAPQPDPKGVGLPDDIRLCPLCKQPRVNPAIMAVSGYAFCYPCLFRHVCEQHCCPVTCCPASLDHIRKLYEAL
eukprot:gene11413-11560_t